MEKTLKQVAEFHKTFKAPVIKHPAIPSESRCDFRVELLTEELKELQDAIDAKDMVEIADALADLQYVLIGAVHEFGLGNLFPAIFDEVHRSNMSKACLTESEALHTIKAYREKDGTNATYIYEEGRYIVTRMSDSKTLKSINYSPADIANIIETDSRKTLYDLKTTPGGIHDNRSLLFYPCEKCDNDKMIILKGGETVRCAKCQAYMTVPTLEQQKSYIESLYPNKD